MRLIGCLKTLLALFLCSILFVNQCDATLAAMSIDLGSQFIKIGLVKPGVPMEIVVNTESQRKTSNIVVLRNGERFFGDIATQMSVKFPQNSITFFVDLIGKQFDSPVVAKYQKDFPHLKLLPHPEKNTVIFDVDNQLYEIETILAMLLWNAQEQTQTFAGQPVKDVVITVPAYFNQIERISVIVAAKIAGLRLLSVIPDGSAAALNYGVFRRKDITEKPQNLLIYDIGATKTVATLVEYSLQKEEPQLKVLGIGFDRTVGGRDITQKLLDHLVKEFKAKHKTSGDILENPRAMAKLWKEAERVKQVLSANTNHFAQVESLFEDKDFKVSVSRELIEIFVEKFRTRFIKPLHNALNTVNFKPEQVENVVLVGAGTRIPMIRQAVKEYFDGKEPAHFLNTDEAIAMGAIYRAAHLSDGFRVKPFEVVDLDLQLDMNISESYIRLLPDLIGNATEMLQKFEQNETVKRRYEFASNALESLVYDTSVKLDEEWLQRENFTADFQEIQKEVNELKVWIEDEAVNANFTTLLDKHDKLFGMIRAVQVKEKEQKQEEAKLIEKALNETIQPLNTSFEFIEPVFWNETSSTPIINVSHDQHTEF